MVGYWELISVNHRKCTYIRGRCNKKEEKRKEKLQKALSLSEEMHFSV